MIESRLDPRIDGIGGGDDGERTVAQIAETFRTLAAEPVPRSVSAILRILREQSKGRKGQTELVFGATTITALVGLLIILSDFGPTPPEGKAFRAFALLAIFPLPLCAGALLTTGRRKRAQAQLAELRRLALETLETVVLSPWFVPRPLDLDERKTLRSLRGSDPEAWARVAWILEGGDE